MNSTALTMRILLFLLACSLITTAYSQEEISSFDKKNTFTRFIHHEKVTFKLEYFGELVLHPGLAFGLEYKLISKKFLSLHWNNDVGGYWHRWNTGAIFYKSSIGSRFSMGPVFADFNIGIGYMHSFAAGTIYQRASDGGVKKARNFGHPHFMPNASLLLGWDATRNGKQNWTIHFGPEVYLQSSFNHIFLPHIAMKLGLTYRLKKR